MKKPAGVNGIKSMISKLFLVSGVIMMVLFGVGPTYSASTQTGVVATVAPDWSSAAHSVISVDPVGGPRSVSNDLLPTSTSDITVNAYGKYFYRIERYQSDSVTKFDVSSPGTPIWQYSTLDTGEGDSSNPHDLVFVSSTKAYLTRYGSTKAWVVNPSTVTEAGFKIGELDLSSYADADGVPEMTGGVIANGKLFIILQRLDSSFCPSNMAYVAVFDVATDTEIDTGLGQGGKKGIPLPIKNPLSIQYLSQNNTIYVQGVGSFPGFCSSEYEYTGGIASINPITYATGMVLDDGDSTDHPYGVISGMMIASPQKGYFVGYDGWKDNTLYKFNPSTGVVAGALDGFKGISISGMESGTYLDKNDMLWVCNQTAYTVDIVDTKDNTIDESVSTSLSPQRVAFCTSGAPLAPTLGATVAGTAVLAHWDTVSGADGYYLWVTFPDSLYSVIFNMGTVTSVSATLWSGASCYIAVIPFNAEGSGTGSNVVHVAVD